MCWVTLYLPKGRSPAGICPALRALTVRVSGRDPLGARVLTREGPGTRICVERAERPVGLVNRELWAPVMVTSFRQLAM